MTIRRLNSSYDTQDMEGMRALLRRELGRSLEAISPDDLFAAAWPIACGKALAARGRVAGYHGDVLQVLVTDSGWAQQMRSMSERLRRELATITGKPISKIDFVVGI
jgi:predicted nucleic acid-binding Zn ribbon protein